VANIDWPSKPGLPPAQQRRELIRILDVSQQLRLNALIFQVRPSADALYLSDFEPWSEFLSGKQGTAPNPPYDPLAFLIYEAHQRGIEIHAWFNPYRSRHTQAKSEDDPRHINRLRPDLAKSYGGYRWLNPADPYVQAHSRKVILDVVRRYDLDGVHIDDYFYPYPLKQNGQNVDFPDHETYANYRSTGGTLSKGDWRRQEVNQFVANLYRSIKSEKRWVKFGISPFGIFRPGVPEGIRAGIDQYAELYADARKWLREGWCDYYAPQLYWPINQEAQSYPRLLQWWHQQNDKQRHLWPGNFTSRTNPASGNWAATEIVNQIQATRKQAETQSVASGNVHFSMKAFLNDWNKVRTRLRQGRYATPAFVPASPWLKSDPPKPPQVLVDQRDDTGWKIEWNSTAEVRNFAISMQSSGKWSAWTYQRRPERTINDSTVRGIAIVAFDRVWNESLPTVINR
jgi:uncharacterized lipoprotein YddW (UPF0748 family)